MRNRFIREHPADLLGSLHREGSHQDRLSQFMTGDHLIDDRRSFFSVGEIDPIAKVHSLQGMHRWQHGYWQPVLLLKFVLGTDGGAGHSAKRLELLDEPFNGNMTQGLTLWIGSKSFFGFQSGLQAVLVDGVGLRPPCGLVDEHQLVLGHQVIHVPLEQQVGSEHLINLVAQIVLPGQAGG